MPGKDFVKYTGEQYPPESNCNVNSRFQLRARLALQRNPDF